MIARELEREIDPKSPHAEDVRLLREQAQRCRDILAKLNELQAEGEPFDGLPLSTLLEEVAEPHRHFGIAIDVKMPAGQASPVAARNPAILYGLGNLVENAVDFAREPVDITADWTDDTVSVVIADDGPGFAPEVIGRIGEPYVAQPQVAAHVCDRRDRPGARLLHRQDPAGAHRRQADLRQPGVPRERRGGRNSLAAEVFEFVGRCRSLSPAPQTPS